ncbi:mechanosensitive ion channel family protein [Shewanella sp. GXUN23E]|uniref:mechanosensitive ion channel family protein n=1 Tax=Shewanella sp. GXUN23E TaxID=3422498 RepID=UPI003D7C52F4
MSKLATTLAAALLSLACLSAFANEAPTSTAPTTQQIQLLQQAIDQDIAQLKTAKGEIRALTEYRIINKITELRSLIATMVAQPDVDTKSVEPLITEQLQFINQVQGYLANNISKLKQELGQADDSQTILLIAKRESERDQFFGAQLETIKWAEKVGMDVSSNKAELIQALDLRGEHLESQVTFLQQQLKAAVQDANAAGKDVSAEQTAKVALYKEWLQKSNASLGSIITLLDELGQNTAEMKKTLFSVSGDITQDVLNIDVASGLLQQWLTTAKSQLIEHGPTLIFKVFIFLLILFVASLVARLVESFVRRAVSTSKLNFSKLLQDFFTKLSSKVVYSIGLLIALSQLGFELGPLLAGFGIAGVIIGFALQDTLSNFASGMMILIYRPFDVGDLINAAGVTGKVSHMSLVSTTIMTLDNQRLIVPNNKIWGDTINNITVEHQRRVDMVFGISYSDNIEHTEQVLHDIVINHPKVLKDPEPTIKLHTLGDSSVDFIVRPWTKPEDYWDVYWDITRAVKMRFDAEGISIPFPQRDVHIYQTSAK